MNAYFVDTNVLIRHLTGDPPGQARRATEFLKRAEKLELTEIVLAECAFVLESYYGKPSVEVANLLRSVIKLPSVTAANTTVLRRAIDIYAAHKQVHFVDALLVAHAEQSAGDTVASFDRDIDRVKTIERIEP